MYVEANKLFKRRVGADEQDPWKNTNNIKAIFKELENKCPVLKENNTIAFILRSRANPNDSSHK